jgi:ATP-binding cassette, subfamily B (MDR/TAP), member 1
MARALCQPCNSVTSSSLSGSWWVVYLRKCIHFEDNSPAQSSVFSAIQAGNVFSHAPDISSAKSAASDVIRLVDSRPEIDAESTEGIKVPTEKVRGQIRLENIHFRYPARPDVRVLRGLSLKVEPGTYIALVGASGSGKSTV